MFLLRTCTPVVVCVCIGCFYFNSLGAGQYLSQAWPEIRKTWILHNFFFVISESDAIDAVAPIRIILAIGRLADSFLFIYLFTAVTYVIYYVHNRSFLFLNLNISVEIRSITNTLLRSSWYICYETIPTKNPNFGPGPEKKRNITYLSR